MQQHRLTVEDPDVLSKEVLGLYLFLAFDLSLLVVLVLAVIR